MDADAKAVTEGRLIPEYLTKPADGVVSPPALTRPQELPFGKLTWDNFERLCFRLATKEARIEHCQLYGVPGQNQQGIDIYAKLQGASKYTVYQCKREKNFGPPKIRKAIEKFLSGEWPAKSERFVLCTKESLRETK